jgi:hypothetical protein
VDGSPCSRRKSVFGCAHELIPADASRPRLGYRIALVECGVSRAGPLLWRMSERLQVGGIAPAFSLPDQSGNEVSLVSFRGRQVLVYFC